MIIALCQNVKVLFPDKFLEMRIVVQDVDLFLLEAAAFAAVDPMPGRPGLPAGCDEPAFMLSGPGLPAA